MSGRLCDACGGLFPTSEHACAWTLTAERDAARAEVAELKEKHLKNAQEAHDRIRADRDGLLEEVSELKEQFPTLLSNYEHSRAETREVLAAVRLLRGVVEEVDSFRSFEARDRCRAALEQTAKWAK